MFGNLRNKFQTVQDGISASLRGLSIIDNQLKIKKLDNIENVNCDAGADVLHHFQLEWNELHELAEENSMRANDIDILIGEIYETLNKQWNSITILNGTLAIIPKINNSIQNLMDKIGTLEESFEEIEISLFKLVDINETLELQNRQLDHRFQLALYKEKKLTELDSVREKLANEHSKIVLQHELKHEMILKERQETFDQVFKGELENYKATGIVPKVSSLQNGPALEEIVLESDFTDFDEFLNN